MSASSLACFLALAFFSGLGCGVAVSQRALQWIFDDDPGAPIPIEFRAMRWIGSRLRLFSQKDEALIAQVFDKTIATSEGAAE